MNLFGTLTLISSSVVNLWNVYWTVWLTIEQFKTGWGFGTKMELGAFWPWVCEAVSVPFVITAIVFLILAIFKKPKKWLVITNAALLGIALLQFGLSNLFLAY